MKSLHTVGFIALAFLFSSCLFDTEKKSGRPMTHFNFAQLDTLENPLSRWYQIPKEKCLVGLAFAFRSMDYQKQIDSNISIFSKEIGHEPFLAGAYFDISSQGKNLRASLDAIHAHGIVPYITFDPKDWDEPDVAYQKSFLALIVRGDFDGKLKELAGVIRDFDFPILLRYAHEMNGDWYYYCGKDVGGGLDLDKNGMADGPQLFIDAWRHVHDLFVSEGATKALWVFCPNGESFPKADWNRPFSYYPGSKYVDFIASDSYEAPEKKIQNLDPILDDFFNEMGLFWESHAADPGYDLRSFGLGEFGTSRALAPEKSAWYSKALEYIADENRIQFQVIYNAQNGKKDFSITGLGTQLTPAYENKRFMFAPAL